MVNSEEFKGRLERICDYYELTAAAFAEEIGVQRSSISHLLSGRNKPSLDFIMKVIQRFPEVDLYWLLNGRGTFPPAPAIPPEESQKETPPPNQAREQAPAVERIVVFYADGTFRSYKPGELL
ncbi:helix-turn-helix transcriptional regulator [Robiginitalea sp. M366]|uniref:helix-turn-helix transcriptional regulator n=1 Tax=Robiginitalea aestuariiviva TaxID=3036903 RepID=UPI00240DD871|nr:helix-turn-helix transcriptional regulator [Robiginitalea aestuariiviva]MDG1572992.1 helix-turn-helix transcriptional regulator [Robiginitalea aestuariiviva]